MDFIDFVFVNMIKLYLDIFDEKILEFLLMFDVLVLVLGYWWLKMVVYIIDGKVVGG